MESLAVVRKFELAMRVALVVKLAIVENFAIVGRFVAHTFMVAVL